MSRIPRFSRALALAGLVGAPLVALGTTPASADHRTTPTEGAPTYTITITNTTDGQWLTPPNVAAHPWHTDVFDRNAPASPGVQAVAENGGVPVLAAELAAAFDDTGSGDSTVGGDAPIAPGDSVTFDLTTSAHRFSIVSMLICTNDGFGGVDNFRLPSRDGATRSYALRSYDAGTELNTEARGDLVPAPFCGDGDGSGDSNPALAENGVIRPHRGIQGTGDLGPDFDFGRRVGEVTITRHDPAPTYTVTIENLTAGQWLTPPNWAVHGRDASVFDRGAPASPGVQAVAENGGVPILAAELAAALDDAGLGTSGVAPADGPIAPGDAVTFEVTASGEQLSIVSMLICTNDGFAGLDSKWLPRWSGDSRAFFLGAYDAGTERNTEARGDLVPAPFCGDGDGSGESNPALAENGVIERHAGIQGTGDLGPDFDFGRRVAKVTITRQ
ncbi:MAG: spondin domain-containing protein [Acidimicrobiales bacterium]